ncbi:MAG: FliA/WhiG family RNA polymerase sigma factor [Nanoarchaeota archaeon]|nr:FliA/WhiG family RNA polymerase sigma factor [Nanoarchaeota archaeon]
MIKRGHNNNGTVADSYLNGNGTTSPSNGKCPSAKRHRPYAINGRITNPDNKGNIGTRRINYLDDIPMSEVWQRYDASKSEEIRNFLIEKYHPIVGYNAKKIYARLPDKVELDDLISAGLFGLIDAIHAYDLTRGIKFETYCTPRIRGAILDELRAMDWVKPNARRKINRIKKTKERIFNQTGEHATDEEIAKELDVPIDIILDAKENKVVNYDYNQIVENNGRNSDEQTTAFKEDFRKCIMKGLTKAERLVVDLYYYGGLTMKEIGLTIDLSESRVSQIHSSIIERLKAKFGLEEKLVELTS